MNILKPHVSLNVSNIDASLNEAWVEDPDGNSWEVFVVKGEAGASDTKAGGGCCG